MDEKSNALEDKFYVKVITHVNNKSSFCLTSTNQDWVFRIKVISGNRRKGLIYVIFKGSDIKPI